MIKECKLLSSCQHSSIKECENASHCHLFSCASGICFGATHKLHWTGKALWTHAQCSWEPENCGCPCHLQSGSTGCQCPITLLMNRGCRCGFLSKKGP